jgi:hypothetical protein
VPGLLGRLVPALRLWRNFFQPLTSFDPDLVTPALDWGPPWLSVEGEPSREGHRPSAKAVFSAVDSTTDPCALWVPRLFPSTMAELVACLETVFRVVSPVEKDVGVAEWRVRE